MSTIYVPGDPCTTKYVDQLWIIANLIERSTDMYVTAAHYGRVIAELQAQHGAPVGAAPGHLMFGKKPELRVINAGTDDEAEVNRRNHATPGAIDYQAKMNRLRVA